MGYRWVIVAAGGLLGCVAIGATFRPFAATGERRALAAAGG